VVLAFPAHLGNRRGSALVASRGHPPRLSLSPQRATGNERRGQTYVASSSEVCVGDLRLRSFRIGICRPSAACRPDTTGWNRVGELRDGQRIIVSVGSGIPMHCVFRGITDHSMFCDTGDLLLGFYQHEIARNDVTRLRTDN
jgi:hypothetical protein